VTQAQTKKPLGICETVLRDSHQSLLATRMRTEDMIPAMEMLDDIGYWSLEVWGGATFDACMRFLNEDPWERLRIMRKRMPKTRLQMLLRGQVVVGYRHYADDVVERFVAKAVENGMQVFRIFDAMNDIRNMETAMRMVRKYGGHVQASVCYTLSPVHNNQGFVKTFKQLLQIGADSLCIKDMGGLISPGDAFDLVTRLKAVTEVPISLHSHYTSGMASMAYFKAAEAGVDMVDCAISSMSLGSSQPPTETLVAALAGTDRATGLDLAKLSDIGKHFAKVRKNYSHLEMMTYGVDTNVLQFQVPGGMISNLVNQLREQGQENKLPEVLKEIPRVRADLGYPPLVTPSSQICGSQAVLNVLLGERYKMVPKEVKSIVKGMYGLTPAPISPEMKKLVLGDEVPIDCRPADLLEPEMEKAKAEIGALAKSEEDVLSYVLFPPVAKEFLANRGKRVVELSGYQLAAIAVALGASSLTHEGKQHAVELKGSGDGATAVLLDGSRYQAEQDKTERTRILVNGQPHTVEVKEITGTSATVLIDGRVEKLEVARRAAPVSAPTPGVAAAAASAPSSHPAAGERVTAPLPGKILSVAVKTGDRVRKGDELCVIEAMKMGNSIRAQRDGIVAEVLVAPNQSVAFGAPLLTLEGELA
jgi:oxaloacetate decarboxylase alpha subunit